MLHFTCSQNHSLSLTLTNTHTNSACLFSGCLSLSVCRSVSVCLSVCLSLSLSPPTYWHRHTHAHARTHAHTPHTHTHTHTHLQHTTHGRSSWRTRAASHSEHRFPAPTSKEGCRKPVLGVWGSVSVTSCVLCVIFVFYFVCNCLPALIVLVS